MSWTVDMDKYPLFSFVFSFKVCEDNFKDKILNFDISFLQLALKYGILRYEYENQSDFDAFLKEYKKERQQDFFKNNNENKYLRLVNIDEFYNYSKSPKIDIYEVANNVFEKSSYKVDTAGGGNSIISISSYGQDELDDLRENNFWEETVSLFLESYSNIWLDIIDLSEVRRSQEKGLIDNR
ncbi:hypothetical protein BWK58_15485, partial [Flavobacterium columnare]